MQSTQTDALCNSCTLRQCHDEESPGSYRRSVSRKASASPTSGRHFAPISLLPYGGFGDPEVTSPYWKVKDTHDPEKVTLSKAQHLLVQEVRLRLAVADISDIELEGRLGYRRTGLTRKLNGHELITMRDAMRLADAFGPSILNSLAQTEESSALVVQEPAPKYEKASGSKNKKQPKPKALPPDHELHTLIQEAAANLRNAASLLRNAQGVDENIRSLSDALASLSKTTAAIGKTIAHENQTSN